MYIKNSVAIFSVLSLLLAIGCSESKSPRSDAIERAKSRASTLTSTASPLPPLLKEEKKPEQPTPDPMASPPIEDAPAFEPELQGADGLEIQRLLTAPEIEHREPVAASGVFGHHDEKVYAFIEASNASHEDKSLLVHFIGPEGQVSGGIELRIPAATPRWRTWAFTEHAKVPGLWRVELRGADGALIGALPFEVEPGC